MCACPLDLSHNTVGGPEQRKTSCGLATVFGKFVSRDFIYLARRLVKHDQGTRCFGQLDETAYALQSEDSVHTIRTEVVVLRSRSTSRHTHVVSTFWGKSS
jgi:hypothetical protein